jgi:2-oxoglutarate dehydrogenase E2 component (dihydrolipoamide succinyltransferase)
MAKIELIMPKMGESVAEATVIKWLKAVGDSIEVDESVLEIATDKVDSEVPSAVEGVLIKTLFNEDDVVKVGEAIAIIETHASDASLTNKSSNAKFESKVSSPTSIISSDSHTIHPEELIKEFTDKVMESNSLFKVSDSKKFYSPLVRSIAKQEHIEMAELDEIIGSGKNGRVTKKDLFVFLKNRSSNSSTHIETVKVSSKPSNPMPISHSPANVLNMEGDEIIQMDRMRKMIANHMVMSKQVSPHVTSFVEADVTNIVLWRNSVKDDFLKKEGQKITFTPIFVDAVVKSIKDFPMINVAVDGTNIIKRKHINIGMAAALPSGNLIVPVIKDADQKNMVGLTKTINDLARRARSNELNPDEISGGTFTLTNVGGFGNIMGTPIINQPQVAIMAVGAIVKKPAVMETEMGDVIAIRHKMFCSLSYDHRVVDGSLGGTFLRTFADYLEAFDKDMSI